MVSSAVGQLEAVIGLDSSVIGTIIGDLRNASSGGGGHVQTANKGGTGQTSYTKGDLLAATSSSVISKLAIGTDNQVLMVNSSTATGVAWGVPNTTKVTTSGSTVGIAFATNPPAAYSVLSVSITGSTLGTTNAIRSTTYINNYTGASGSVLLAARYGNNQVASIVFRSAAASVAGGRIDYTLIADNSALVQRGILELYLTGDQGINVGSIMGFRQQVQGVSSVNSSANQTMGLTMQAVTDSMGSLQVVGYTVEKIL